MSQADVDERTRMTVALGSDHLGAGLKDKLGAHLAERGYTVKDLAGSATHEVDYPDVAAVVAASVVEGEADRAILVCGTGLGMAISANKVHGVRAASVTDIYSAERASRSNDVQVLCLGALVVGEALAYALVDKWLESEFDGARSGRKVAKIEALETGFGAGRTA